MNISTEFILHIFTNWNKVVYYWILLLNLYKILLSNHSVLNGTDSIDWTLYHVSFLKWQDGFYWLRWYHKLDCNSVATWTCLQELWGFHENPDPRRGPGEDEISGEQGEQLGAPCHNLLSVEHQLKHKVVLLCHLKYLLSCPIKCGQRLRDAHNHIYFDSIVQWADLLYIMYQVT